MKKYRIVLSEDASNDMDELKKVIVYDYHAPEAAFRYLQGLLDAILFLSKSPKSFSIQKGKSFLRFGSNVRRLNYKKMAVIYTVHSDTVYVHRIVAAKLITDI